VVDRLAPGGAGDHHRGGPAAGREGGVIPIGRSRSGRIGGRAVAIGLVVAGGAARAAGDVGKTSDCSRKKISSG
jgi:hypothetical protein